MTVLPITNGIRSRESWACPPELNAKERLIQGDGLSAVAFCPGVTGTKELRQCLNPSRKEKNAEIRH